jgi:hypothetical protein
MPQRETIVQIGAEGGSITLYGVRTDHGWLYSTSTYDGTPAFIDEESIKHDSGAVDSWEAALRLLDRYPWHKLYPLQVHSEFGPQIWSALEKRFGSGATSKSNMDRWRELCTGHRRPDGPRGRRNNLRTRRLI